MGHPPFTSLKGGKSGFGSIVWPSAMREVNLLNRFTRQFLFLIVLVTQICGVTTFVYNSKAQCFRHSGFLRFYSSLVLIFLTLFLMVTTSKMFDNLQAVWPYAVGSVVMLVVRIQGFLESAEIVELLNQMLRMMRQVNLMARHPNLFRLKHLLLLLLALQNLLRSLNTIVGINKRSAEAYDTLLNSVVLLIVLAVLLSFLLQITINICLFVVLIATYSELHHCTRRISNDMDKLRLYSVLESGQFMVLVKQLQGITEKLIRLHHNVFRITVRITRHFRFHWLCAIIYGLIPFFSLTAKDQNGFYFLIISALNIIFQWTIFAILSRESRITRSLCTFYLTNYHMETARTIDELLHQEIWERITVTIYGITLDTKLLFKLLSISAFCAFVNRLEYLHIQCPQ
ncbi:GM13831 [Drosophila sechellia]|uniref:Gustatory receptor n=2 Tax=Drosophila sechellia TaxID=7238 RepID=B4HUW3_DROSE|nr:GM13831 [Drosophila sechellia]